MRYKIVVEPCGSVWKWKGKVYNPDLFKGNCPECKDFKWSFGCEHNEHGLLIDTVHADIKKNCLRKAKRVIKKKEAKEKHLNKESMVFYIGSPNSPGISKQALNDAYEKYVGSKEEPDWEAHSRAVNEILGLDKLERTR